MDKIMEPNEAFPFERLVLASPTFISSGNYFIKYLFNDFPLYIQPPKCITKQGIIKGGKKMYCDLMFTNEHENFIRWMEDLETYSQRYIFNNRSKWFESDLEMHDIENSFTTSMKVYKSGKFYIIRTIVPSRLGKCTLKIFDENEMDVSSDSIKDSTTVITIWEIQGIKCSTKSFQIDIEIKQMMVVKPDNLFEKCIIGKTRDHPSTENDDTNKPWKMATKEGELILSQALATASAGGDEGPDHGNRELDQEQPSTQDVSQIHGSLVDDTPANVFIGLEEPEHTASSEMKTSTIGETSSTLLFDQAERGTAENIENTFLATQPDQDQEYLGENPEDNDEPNDHTFDVYEVTPEEGEIPPPASNDDGLEMVVLNLDEIDDKLEFKLKARNDVYYEMYMEAKQKAEDARNLAITAYLEAKRIKELYMIQEPLDTPTDLDKY